MNMFWMGNNTPQRVRGVFKGGEGRFLRGAVETLSDGRQIIVCLSLFLPKHCERKAPFSLCATDQPYFALTELTPKNPIALMYCLLWGRPYW